MECKKSEKVYSLSEYHLMKQLSYFSFAAEHSGAKDADMSYSGFAERAPVARCYSRVFLVIE
jgi:hypothetical protein